jgi:hypothetical protein
MARNKNTVGYANKLKYINEYNKENYEKITVQVKKGIRKQYQDMAADLNMSFKEFMLEAMEEYYKKQGGKRQ